MMIYEYGISNTNIINRIYLNKNIRRHTKKKEYGISNDVDHSLRSTDFNIVFLFVSCF
jgi:hypothetical protein